MISCKASWHACAGHNYWQPAARKWEAGHNRLRMRVGERNLARVGARGGGQFAVSDRLSASEVQNSSLELVRELLRAV